VAYGSKGDFKIAIFCSFAAEEDQLFPPTVYTLATSENSRDRDMVEAFIHHRIQVLSIFYLSEAQFIYFIRYYPFLDFLGLKLQSLR
jgi:hypothetical protein